MTPPIRGDRLHWDLGDLPFLWNPLPTPHNPDGLPDTLPFTLGEDGRSGALVQEPHPGVAAALAHAYKLGSMITGQMDESGIGRGYADDFLAFVNSVRGGAGFGGRRVLEIGCGNGYLLSRLRALGAAVLGIDPGNHAHTKYDVPILQDFFPSPRVAGRFDLIIMFGVLEHVEDPVALLQQAFPLLEPGGDVLISVPDCGPYIEAGDLSCLIHEHWSYFDQSSLARTLRIAGGIEVDVTRGSFGGVLYARAAAGTIGAAGIAIADAGDAGRTHDGFRARAEHGTQAIVRYLTTAARAGQTVGLYVPGRAINALFVGRAPVDHCRFFDDNALLKGTYFPGLPIAIEDRAALLGRPTDHVVVMSRSFGQQIAGGLAQVLAAATRVVSWQTLFEPARR